ncbi:hypothetical protein [Desulfosarcina alkanivorans]|uniref:hypothetical protein n=1 Tax=Desulfosarcina alkanivorans TaxID=571177 RepID=UPI0012D33A8D|nr:hypothetical protein [Desulfosarcina alkanivorans]
MTDHTIKTCPKCGQQLRFPEKIGGVLMACPSCGHRFQSDFKLERPGRRAHRNLFTTLFEMPSALLRRICRLVR